MERYLSFAEYCRRKYGKKLYRAALDAHMTCPNRDGTKGTGGCIFCSAAGSGDFAVSYSGQRMKREDLIYNHQEEPDGSFIAYFQSFTNTYAPAEKLRELFEAALEDPLFAGISAATRPDCLPPDVISLFRNLRKKYPDKIIWAELGLQSVHEESGRWMRRGYTTEDFDEAVRNLHEAGIEVIAHMIIGIPGETEEMIMQTADHISDAGVEGVKIHLLHYLKDTDLGRDYMKAPEKYHIPDMDEYARLVCRCISRLDPSIAIHRITGDGDRNTLLAPLWSLDKRAVINLIRHQLKEEGITQGCGRTE